MSTTSQTAEPGNTPPDDSFISLNRSYREGGCFSVRVTVLGKPAPAGSKRAIPTRRDWRVVPGVRWQVVDANKDAAPWKKKVAEAATKAMAGISLLEGPLFLRVAFYVPRPKTVKRERPTVAPDATKLLRGVEDAMTGVVYRDDAQIVHQVVTKHYGEPARTEIQVACLFPGEERGGRA